MERSLTDGTRYCTLLMSNATLMLREYEAPQSESEWKLLVTTSDPGSMPQAGSDFSLTEEETKSLQDFLDRLLSQKLPCTFSLRRSFWKRFVWKVKRPARHSEFTRELKGSIFFWTLPNARWASNVVSLREVEKFRRSLVEVYGSAA